MRLTTVDAAGGRRVGVLDGDLIRLLEPGPSLLEVIRGGAEALAEVARRARTGDAVEVGAASFAPLLEPPGVRDFLTYERHLAALAGSVPTNGTSSRCSTSRTRPRSSLPRARCASLRW